MGRPWQTLEGQLLARTRITPRGCWEKTRGLTKKGYGQIKVQGKTRRAHIVAYEHWIGPVPDGMFVLHKCDNRACIQPYHLFLGTAQNNTDDMMNKGRHVSREKLCPHNSAIGRWDCLECKREYNRTYYLENKKGTN